MSIRGKHLTEHKAIFDRHQSGESYSDIASSLGISKSRAREKAIRWEVELTKNDSIYVIPVTVYFSIDIAHQIGIEAAKMDMSRSGFLRLAAKKMLDELKILV